MGLAEVGRAGGGSVTSAARLAGGATGASATPPGIGVAGAGLGGAADLAAGTTCRFAGPAAEGFASAFTTAGRLTLSETGASFAACFAFAGARAAILAAGFFALFVVPLLPGRGREGAAPEGRCCVEDREALLLCNPCSFPEP